MTPRSRSLSGATLMLMIIPFIAGLLACMPVPIGNPERSRIDPELTGVWAILAGSDSADDAGFYIFEPYDKRTWLVTGVPIETSGDVELSDFDLSTYAGFVKLSAADAIGDDHTREGSIFVYKAWLTKLGGKVFMTWEPKLLLDDGIPEPVVWFVYRVLKDSRDQIRLQMVDSDSDLFDDVDETRRAYERVIAKHAENPELYCQDSDEPSFATLARVQETEMGLFEDLVELFVDWD